MTRGLEVGEASHVVHYTAQVVGECCRAREAQYCLTDEVAGVRICVHVYFRRERSVDVAHTRLALQEGCNTAYNSNLGDDYSGAAGGLSDRHPEAENII